MKKIAKEKLYKYYKELGVLALLLIGQQFNVLELLEISRFWQIVIKIVVVLMFAGHVSIKSDTLNNLFEEKKDAEK